MKKFRFNAVQKEWLARVVMVAVFVGLPMLADAAPTEDANISKIGKTITNIVMTLIATAVLAVGLIRCGMLGITYMAKPENERGNIYFC
ncbi:hypothetical protein AGMMS4956_19760 [Bacteroidia bacterium]|nr:hypothetical protein AGMMS4956_19760 [Bacteroidia bacterium]